MTPEMRLALDVMKRAGSKFYATMEVHLACGCIVIQGYDTETYDPTVGLRACTEEHERHGLSVGSRWSDPDVIARFTDVAPAESYAELLREEIAR